MITASGKADLKDKLSININVLVVINWTRTPMAPTNANPIALLGKIRKQIECNKEIKKSHTIDMSNLELPKTLLWKTSSCSSTFNLPPLTESSS